jgi:geranylgeranyl pyrophosphate synthase
MTSISSELETFERFLQQKTISHLQRDGGETPANLSNSIQYSLFAPGKRIRPRLVIASARLLGVPSEVALRLGAAIEMIHCFTLIHDDLPCMDNDDFRRGRPSNHKVHGESVALLAGNSLMALAFELVSDCRHLLPDGISQEGVFAALDRLLTVSGPRGVLGGQAQEFLLSQESPLTAVKAMFAGKTGALFVASVLMPADFALLKRFPEKTAALTRFAEALGFAFQVMDDFDDAPQADSAERSKPTNILFHLSEAEASREGRAPLLESMRQCESAFGTSEFSELKALAAEVLARIPE